MQSPRAAALAQCHTSLFLWLRVSTWESGYHGHWSRVGVPSMFQKTAAHIAQLFKAGVFTHSHARTACEMHCLHLRLQPELVREDRKKGKDSSLCFVTTSIYLKKMFTFFMYSGHPPLPQNLLYLSSGKPLKPYGSLAVPTFLCALGAGSGSGPYSFC